MQSRKVEMGGFVSRKWQTPRNATVMNSVKITLKNIRRKRIRRTSRSDVKFQIISKKTIFGAKIMNYVINEYKEESRAQNGSLRHIF